MKKSVFAIITCTMVVLFSGCGNDNTAGAVSSGGNGSEQVIETDITEEQDAPEIQESSVCGNPETGNLFLIRY